MSLARRPQRPVQPHDSNAAAQRQRGLWSRHPPLPRPLPPPPPPLLCGPARSSSSPAAAAAGLWLHGGWAIRGTPGPAAGSVRHSAGPGIKPRLSRLHHGPCRFPRALAEPAATPAARLYPAARAAGRNRVFPKASWPVLWGFSFCCGLYSSGWHVTQSSRVFCASLSDVDVLLLFDPPPPLLQPAAAAAALPASRQPVVLQLPSEPKSAPATRYERGGFRGRICPVAFYVCHKNNLKNLAKSAIKEPAEMDSCFTRKQSLVFS